MKIAPTYGVCSAVWTFFYMEVYPGDPMFKSHREYYTINHEIDIEMPGRSGPQHTGFSFSKALMNTWESESAGEHTVSYVELGSPQNDGNFHVYRFDWHTGNSSIGQSPEVKFYVDGSLVKVITTNVPRYAGRLWIGAWFPRNWAGVPNFSTTQLEVDWVRITPFHEDGDLVKTESYPDFGWA